MKKLIHIISFVICAHALAADSANDVIFTQRKSDNSGNIQRNIAAAGAITSTATFLSQLGIAPLVSPTFTTPTLGVASATTINKVALTAPATGATITIADGKTLTASNTLTLAGTDGSTLNVGAGGTLGTSAYVTLGTGVGTALALNVGSDGAFVTFNGALGTPSSGTVTNLTGTASININGTVGATTPSTVVATTIVAGSTTSLLLGTAGSAVGNIGFRNATSGTATLAPPTGALGTYSVTLPNAASTLPIFGQQITFTGPASARTITLLDAAYTTARQDAAQTFTGVQSFTSPDVTTSITTPSASFTAFAGATTLMTIGGTGASASSFFPSTLDATSSTTGAIRTSGGISAAKAANFGTTLNVAGISGLGIASSSTTNLNLAASTTGVSSLRLAHGSAPSAPVNGDMWTTSAGGLYVRINGATVGPLAAAGGITVGDTQVLFADGANTPAGDAGMTYNKTTDTLTLVGSVVSGSGSAVSGTFVSVEGTAPSLTANAFSIYSATDVAAGGLAYSLPAAASSGVLQATNTAGVMAITHSALTSGRVTFATTNGLLSDDADLAFATDTLTVTKISTPTIEMGSAATDTTLTRSAAGVIAVEGNIVSTVLPRITTVTSNATPTYSTDTCDVLNITALAAAITSMTSNRTGTINNFQQLEIRIKDDGTARAITWGADFSSGMATLPTTTILGKTLTVYLEGDTVTGDFMCMATGSYP